MGPQVCRLADAVSDTEQLRRFRSGFYRCLTGWADAAFELTDAALCAPAPVSSIRVRLFWRDLRRLWEWRRRGSGIRGRGVVLG